MPILERASGLIAGASASISATLRYYRAAGWPLISRLLKGRHGLVMDGKSTLDPRHRPQQIELRWL